MREKECLTIKNETIMKAIFNIAKNIRNSRSISALGALRKLQSLGLLLCALMIGSLQVWGTETAFSWAGSSTADAGTTDYVVTDSPITLTFSQGTHANNAPRTNKEGSVRMYTGNTLTIASSSGNITRVVFTPTSSTYDATHLTYGGDGLTSDDWTLASASASVTLSATANARFTAITVYSGSSTYTVTIAKNQASWGTVDKNSVTGVANNTSISASSNVLTVGATTVTATPHAQDADYNYEFSSWGGIPASGKVTANVTVTANFTRTERTLTNYRTTCTACEAPNHVDIAGAWDRFAGETISLTATAYSSAGTGSPIDDGDITGYQWYKGGTAEGNKIAGATSATYTKNNCTLADAGDYYCKISTGATCSTMSSSFGVKVYALDCYTGGTATHNFTRVGETQTGTLQLTLTASTGYEFKVRQGSVYLGNNGTINEDENTWEFTTSGSNVTVNSGLGGTFTFTLDYSSNADAPILAVTYPRKTIYLVPNSDWLSNSAKFAYYYYGASGTDRWTDFIAANECGMSAEIPQWNGITVIAVRLNSDATAGSWDKKWNQTDDIALTADKNLITITGWNNSQTYTAYSIPTYTISYAKGSVPTGGGSISGSKADESKTCGVDFTLPNSAVFSTTGYTQTGWATSDGGSQAYAFGGSYTTNAAQAFYPAWTPKQTTVSFNQNGGDGGQTGTVTATYGSAMPSTPVTCPTKTGYTFGGYYDGEGGTGTQYYTNTGASARSWDKVNATYTLYAKWTAKQTTVSFNQNGGTGGQTTSKTATYDQAMPTPITVPTREGYTFGGYYESTGGTGAQYYTNAGASAKNWDKTDATWTLYAKWTVNNYTLTWDWNGGSTSSTTHTAAGSVAYGTTLVYPADGTMSKTGYTFTGWSSTPSTMPASSTTITAQWSVNSYNVAVQTVSYVTIKATPSGGSAITEGNNADVAYNTTITLNYSSKDSRYTWGGWRVTKAGDPSVVVFSGTANNATFPMPDYAITVTAYLYSDAIAWCDPDVTVTGDVHLTSTKDVYVNTTSGAGNLLNVASTDLGSATSMDIAYLNADAEDAEVDKAASAFRLYASDASAAIDASSSSVDISAARTFDTDYSMRYTPTAYSQYNNYKLQLTFKKGDKVLKTVKKPIYGRGLPEEFVIAVKKGDIWVALPNDLATTSAQPAIVPLPITVDNTTTPTEAVYTPINTVYKAMNRGNDSHISTIRFTTTGSNYLQVSGSSAYNMWLSTTNSANVQDWQLKSSDNSAYELTIPSNNVDKKMGIYNNTYMGYHGSPNNADIYILPITNTYTDIPATVHEWGEHGAILEADMTGVASATMHVADGSAAAATLTPVNAASLTEGKYVRIYKSDMTVGAVANENKQLYVHWKNAGGDEIGVSQVTIPCVIAADNDMYSIATTKKAWGDKSEVHILPGVTLDANAGSFSGDGALSVSHMEVYPGATLKVSTGTFNATTLRLRNGWTRAGDKQYNSARVYIASSAALTKTTASMDYDIYEASDGKHYYPLAVPFATAVNTIDYIDPTLAAASTYNKHFVIKGYDGANRAINGEDSNNNWDVVAEDATLQPGIGYIMTAVAVKGSAIIRVPLAFDNGWTSDGEKATYDAVTKNVVAVTAYSGAKASENQRHKGWNMLGVPFMSCYGAGTDMYSGGGSAALINGEIVISSGADPYSYINTTIPYVSVPSHDFAEYIQTDISDTKLLPGWSFFVQVNTDGNLTFNVSNREPDEDNPIYAPRHRKAEEVVRTGIILSRGETSDKTTILVSDKYSSEYEVGADLEKMFGSGYTLATYSLSNGTRLAYNALCQTDAQQLIPIGYRAPEDGEYTFSLNPRYAENSAFEHVYLIDYQTGDITDLMASSYTFSTVRTQEDTRFTINVVPRKLTTTDIEGGAATESRTQKILLNDKLYIIRGGHMYDATGKRVSEINK